MAGCIFCTCMKTQNTSPTASTTGFNLRFAAAILKICELLLIDIQSGSIKNCIHGARRTSRQTTSSLWSPCILNLEHSEFKITHMQPKNNLPLHKVTMTLNCIILAFWKHPKVSVSWALITPYLLTLQNHFQQVSRFLLVLCRFVEFS